MKLSTETKELLQKHKDGIGLTILIIFGWLVNCGLKLGLFHTIFGYCLMGAAAIIGFLFGKFIWREGFFASLLMGLVAAIALMFLEIAVLGLAKLLFIFDLPMQVSLF